MSLLHHMSLRISETQRYSGGVPVKLEAAIAEHNLTISHAHPRTSTLSRCDDVRGARRSSERMRGASAFDNALAEP